MSNTYFIGTTTECFKKIMESKFISRTPPERVWPEYSENFVYLVPDADDKEEHEMRIYYAFVQAAYAVYRLGHTGRVVMEIENLNEDLIEIDEVAKGIHARQYPKDISIDHIKRVLFTSKDEQLQIFQCVAKEFLNRDDELLRKFHNTRYELEKLVMENDKDVQEVMTTFFANWPLKHLDKMPLDYIGDEEAFIDFGCDLLEELYMNGASYEEKPLLFFV